MKKHVTFVLDETGSMQSIKDDVIGGYNQFISELKQEDGEMTFTLLKFDSNHRTIVHDAVPVKQVPDLTTDTYRPGSSTPLLDATMEAIRNTEKKVDNDTRTVVAIYTDGLENASKETSAEALKSLLKEKEGKGWFFTFLGVGIDAFAAAGMMGIAKDAAINVNRNKGGAAFAAAARSSRQYVNSGSRSAACYTSDERNRLK